MIVVVGAGPAGIAAALRAQECGARVTVIDDNPAPGGQIWRGDDENSWVARFRSSGIPLLSGTRVVSVDVKAHSLLVETDGVSGEVSSEEHARFSSAGGDKGQCSSIVGVATSDRRASEEHARFSSAGGDRGQGSPIAGVATSDRRASEERAHGPAAARVPFPVGASVRGSRASEEHARFSVTGGDRGQDSPNVGVATSGRWAYKKLVLATGSRELFLPFPGWTLPGVFGLGGLQALAKTGLPVAGKRIVLGGTGPLLLAVGAYLRQHGADVKLIAEQANIQSLAGFAPELLRHPRKVLQGASLQWAIAGTPYRTGCWIESAAGRNKLERVTVRSGRDSWTEDCDYAGVAWGLVPNTELFESLGPDPEDVYVAGSGEVDLSFVEGEIAGLNAAGYPERTVLLAPKHEKARSFAAALATTFALREELKHLAKPSTIVCRCEDVTYGQLQNFTSFRSARLQTRCGMGPCQSRICGPAAEFLFGWETGSVRPPVFPAKIATLLPDTAA